MATMALTAGAITTPSRAQTAPASVQMAQLDRRASFDIPAQPLTSALALFGRQSGLQVTVDGALVRDLSTPGVRGEMTAEQALQRLLSGTGITYSLAGGTTITLRRVSQNDGTIVLNPVTVEGQAGPPRQAEIGNLPPAYAGGQVARGGKVGILGNRDMMDTPFNQTNYTAKLIQDQQAKKLSDVLANDPSVVTTFDPASGFDEWNIRGFGGASVAFGGLFNIAPWQADIMAPESIERVEVLKGANALLNGIGPNGGADLGFVNVVPKRANDVPLTEFTPDYATNSQFGGHVDIGRRFGRDNAFGVRFNGVFRDGDTPIDHQSRETRLAALGLDYRGRAVRLSADLGYQYQNTTGIRRSIRIAPGVPVPDAPDSSSNYAQPWTFLETETLYGVVRGELDILDNLTAYAAVGGLNRESKTQSENRTLQDAAGTLTGNPFGTARSDHDYSAEAGLRGHGRTGPVDHDIVLSSALSVQNDDSQSGNAVTLPASNLFNPVYFSEPNFDLLDDPGDAPKLNRFENSGFALADTLSIYDERIQLMLGMRSQRVQFESASGTRYDEEALTPAAALVVKPWESVSLYANYAEALERGPTAPLTAANANEVFPPTKTEQYEVGAKVDTGRVAATLAAFTTTRPNGSTDPSTNVFGLNGETRYRGVEFTTFGEPTEGVRIIGGITWLDARLQQTSGGVNEGNRTAGFPEYRATLTGEWDTPFIPGLTLSATGQWQSSTFVDDANTQKIDGWYRFDLGARYTIERPNAEPIIIRATVRNVADTDYWASSLGRLGLNEPRTFLLSTTFRF